MEETEQNIYTCCAFLLTRADVVRKLFLWHKTVYRKQWERAKE